MIIFGAVLLAIVLDYCFLAWITSQPANASIDDGADGIILYFDLKIWIKEKIWRLRHYGRE